MTIELDIQKLKGIKEKNIKNEVTKYEISINVIVEIKNKDFTKNSQLIIVKKGEYIVSDQYSQTNNNEKKMIDSTSKKINELHKNLKHETLRFDSLNLSIEKIINAE